MNEDGYTNLLWFPVDYMLDLNEVLWLGGIEQWYSHVHPKRNNKNDVNFCTTPYAPYFVPPSTPFFLRIFFFFFFFVCLFFLFFFDFYFENKFITHSLSCAILNDGVHTLFLPPAPPPPPPPPFFVAKDTASCAQ